MIWINKRIPFRGFKAMAIFPIIFVRKELANKFTDSVENHEKIHFKQQKELLLFIFIAWYIIEWFIRLFLKGRAYKNICFEREAKLNQKNADYIQNRKRYSFIKYL